MDEKYYTNPPWSVVFDMAPEMQWRRCFSCGAEGLHVDSIAPWVKCRKCGSQDTRLMRKETSLLRGE